MIQENQTREPFLKFSTKMIVQTGAVPNLGHLVVCFLVCLHVDNPIDSCERNSFQSRVQTHHNPVSDISALESALAVANDPLEGIPTSCKKITHYF